MLATPFLKDIAQNYVAKEQNLLDICFVTPNKRSAIFLTKHLSDELKAVGGDKAVFLPSIMTISDLVADFSGNVEASRIEQLFLLYNVYSDILKQHLTPDEIKTGKNLIDFNRFQYWGDILLTDFNDVDKYLVDSRQLFKNVENLKEISANYLTPEQIEVIRRYWNDDLVPEPVKEFWNHAITNTRGDSNGKRNVAGFVKLWQVMNEIYEDFRGRLRSRGMTYSGMAYRDTVEIIKETDADDLPFKRYVFVGFNVLSTSEHKIFSLLRDYGVADFYWDYASPTFPMRTNRASQFLRKLVKEFPSLYPVANEPLKDYPDVTVIAMPSTTAQPQLIGPILRKLHPAVFADADASQEELVNTAIVLPDENLCLPLLHSLPGKLTNVNVTMGFSLRQTPVASLLKNIISMQLRARKLKFENTFFYEDVLAVLSHPLIRTASSETCDLIVKDINLSRLFNIPVSHLQEKRFASLRPIFEVVENVNDSNAVFGYFERLIDWLMTIVRIERLPSAEEDDIIGVIKAGSPVLEAGFLQTYKDAISELRRLESTYLKPGKIFMEDKTVFHLVERVVGNQTVSFEGMPLKGLQIMGVLEARALDFDNIVITSMNERVFPRKHYSKSFIPNALRRSYGMATLEFQESIYAYYFYRMITRANRVFLLYDSRNIGARSGNVSRYVNQLKYIFPANRVKFLNGFYDMKVSDSPVIEIAKTPRILEKLKSYKDETGGRFLSASSINDYIRCPLEFYLKHVERYYEEQELKDYMDEGTFGTVIHETLETLYMEARGESEEIEMTPGLIAKLKNEKLIARHLSRAIKKHYLKLDPDDPRPLTGDSAIYVNVIPRNIRYMLDRERELGRFFFRHGERPASVRLKINDSLTANFTFRIDRVDRGIDDNGDSFIRLIDYKTGSDAITVPEIERLFDPDAKARPKAILQLLLYCNAYAQHENYFGPIQPMLYLMKKMAVDKIKPLSIAKTPVNDYRIFNDQFMALLSKTLDELFDPDIPFIARPDKEHCKYCKFTDVCRVPNA